MFQYHCISVADNGVGYPKDFSLNETPNVGCEIIDSTKSKVQQESCTRNLSRIGRLCIMSTRMGLSKKSFQEIEQEESDTTRIKNLGLL